MAKRRKWSLLCSCDNHHLDLTIVDDESFDVHHLQNEGLGLKNIRTKCELMNGKFEYTSVLEKGSSFHIYLPL